jgi:hypothetical protein
MTFLIKMSKFVAKCQKFGLVGYNTWHGKAQILKPYFGLISFVLKWKRMSSK